MLGGWYSRKSDVKTFPGFGAFAGGVDEGSVVVRGWADDDAVFARGSVYSVLRSGED